MQADGGGPASSDELWAGLVVEIAAMPDVVANLLREHQPDERGFCTGTGCGTAGRGAPITPWPCALHTLAVAAETRRAEVAADARRGEVAADARRREVAARPSDDAARDVRLPRAP